MHNVEHISYSAVTEEGICKALPESHFCMDFFFGFKKRHSVKKKKLLTILDRIWDLQHSEYTV